MIHHHTIWKLIRNYTKRQIASDGVDEICFFLELAVKYIVEESENLLVYNGTKKSRISRDCVRAILYSKKEISLATIGRRYCQKKKIK